MKLFRFGRYIGLLLSALLLLMTVLLVTVLHYDAAGQYLVERAAASVEGLSYGEVEGDLWHGMVIKDLSLHQESVKLDIPEVQMAIDWWRLLQAEVYAKKLVVRSPRLAVEGELADTEVTLPALSVPFTAGIGELVISDAGIKLGEDSLHLDALQLSAAMYRDHLTLHSFSLRQGAMALSGEGKLQLAGDWPLSGRVDWKIPMAETLKDIFMGDGGRGSAQLSGTVRNMLIQYRVKKPQVAEGEARVSPLRAMINFDIKSRWKTLAVQVKNEPLKLQNGQLQLSGSLADYQLKLTSKGQFRQLPALAIKLKGHGNLHSFTFAGVDLAMDGSKAALDGKLDWQSGVAWQLSGHVEDFDLAFLPGADSKLSFELASTGSYLQKIQGELRVDAIKGYWQQKPAGGYLHINLDGQNITKSDVSLSVGDSRFALKGSVTDNLAVHLDAHSSNLSDIRPGLAGQLEASAELTGSRDQPYLTGYASARDLSYGDISLASLVVDIKHLAGEKQAMQADVKGENLQYRQNMLFSGVHLAGKGNLVKSNITVHAVKPSLVLDGAADIYQDGQHWQAGIYHLQLDNKSSGLWRLEKNAAFSIDDKTLQLETLCLLHEDKKSRLCVNAEGPLDAPSAKLSVISLPMQSFAGLLTVPVTLTGSVDADATVHLVQGNWQGSADVSVSAGSAIWQEEENLTESAEWQSAVAHFKLHDQKLVTEAQLAFGDQPSLAVNGEVQLTDDYPLNGDLSVDIQQLDWLELFLPVNAVRGSVKGHLSISGSIIGPEFSGRLALQDGYMQVPVAGIELEDITLKATAATGRQVVLSGHLASGQGSVQMKGHIDTAEPFPWPVTLDITGNHFQVANRHDAVVSVTPDIQVHVLPARLQLRGDLKVDQALLTPRELPRQAAGISPDVRRVGVDHESPARLIDTDIDVSLGNNVQFRGFGLDARFSGDARIEDKPDKPISLTGRITIEDGRYKAYGQNLVVERGHLYFQGAPDNPGLDVLAMRNVPAYNVRVGLDIGGTLKQPQSVVVSTPAMEETEAMAYLLTGKPLSGASQSDANAILQAIAVYGIKQGDFIAGRLSETLGIDIGVDTEEQTDTASLMLGKQLSPNLYLRYSVGLFEAISTVMLRYSLNKNVSLETSTTGDNQSIDLLYRQER